MGEKEKIQELHAEDLICKWSDAEKEGDQDRIDAAKMEAAAYFGATAIIDSCNQQSAHRLIDSRIQSKIGLIVTLVDPEQPG